MQNTQAEYHLLLFDCIFVYSLMKVIMFMSVRQHF